MSPGYEFNRGFFCDCIGADGLPDAVGFVLGKIFLIFTIYFHPENKHKQEQ